MMGNTYRVSDPLRTGPRPDWADGSAMGFGLAGSGRSMLVRVRAH
jgi:hypothetical protein